MSAQVEPVQFVDVQTVMTEIFSDLASEISDEPLELSINHRLIDLGIESISLVYLISELQQHFGLGDGLFRMLREEGRLLKEMTVYDVVVAVVQLSGRSTPEAVE